MTSPHSLLVLGGALAFAFSSASAQTPVYKDSTAAVESRVDDLLKRLSTAEKLKLLGGTGFTTQPIERLGVPAFQMSDASCGVRHELPSPAYTASVELAATWDTDLAQKVGRSIGRDALQPLLAHGQHARRPPARRESRGGEQ